MVEGGKVMPATSEKNHIKELRLSPSTECIDDVNKKTRSRDSSCGSSECEERFEEEKEEQNGDSQLPYPGFLPVTLLCLPQTHRLRLVCLQLITSIWFERLVILIILLNCFTLGMYQPCFDAQGCTTTRCRVLAVLDNVIYGFFLFEMIIKVIAMGFIGKQSYLAETWNRLDFFIIIAGAAEYGLENGEINLSAIRTIRVLRPLRAINRIPNLRILVMLLLDTLPMLGNVLIICFFVFFIFGILGVQLWSGMLRQRCFMPENITTLIEAAAEKYNRTNPINPYYHAEWSQNDFICATPGESGMLHCSDIEPLILDGLLCTEDFFEEDLDPNFRILNNDTCVNYNQYYTECKPNGPNPFQESISFDNIAQSWIAIFQVISLEGWVKIMYYIQDVYSFWVWIYFLALIVIGSFFMVNLFLVVIATQFSETKRRETEKMAEERKRYRSSTTLTSMRTESDGCYNQMLRFVIHVVRRNYRKLQRSYKGWKQNKAMELESDTIMADIKLNAFGNHIYCQPCDHLAAFLDINPAAPIASPEPSDIDSVSHISYMSKHLLSSPMFQRRSPMNSLLNEPVIVVSAEEADVISSMLPGYPNGSLKIAVDANRAETSVMHMMPWPQEKRNHNHRLKVSPQISPSLSEKSITGIKSDSTVLDNDISVTVLKRSSSHDVNAATSLKEDAKGCFLSPPNHTSMQRLQVPSDQGSNYSIHSGLSTRSKVSSIAHNLEYINPYEKANSNQCNIPRGFARPAAFCDTKRFSFSQLSYMQGGCDLCCSECQHLCKEYQKQIKRQMQQEAQQSSINHKIAEMVIKFRAKIKRFVDGPIFRNGILGAILVNTVTMGIEHHNQPPLLTEIVENANLVFIGIFSFEMVMKIIGYGCLLYIKDSFNVFDGIIVIMSFAELAMDGNNSGLSVLRTFRLLRILKLIRFLPSLQRQFIVMVRTLDNVASFFGLLVLFMFIFSVLGMNLFGCLFCKTEGNNETTCSRRNFDSLLWSLITVFQVLTQEDWNIVMYDGMARTSHWAALYFVALMTIGNYVLFNLLVAILVEGFSSVLDGRCHVCGLSQACSCPFLLRADVPVKKKTIPHGINTVSFSDNREQRGELASEEALNELKKQKIKNKNMNNQKADDNLPSIITDHADAHLKQVANTSLSLVIPPIITHTAATPRGSPKSELNTPYAFYLEDKAASYTMFNKSENLSPKLSSKSSFSSRSLRNRSQSEDKLSLMENEINSGEENEDDEVFVKGSSSFVDGIQNKNLLQIPDNFNGHLMSPETTLNNICFEMDKNSRGFDAESTGMISKSPTMQLTVQIPDGHLTPKSCNGSIHAHLGLLKPNGSLAACNFGEQTPLLMMSKNHLTELNENSSSGKQDKLIVNLEEIHKTKSISRFGSVYSKLGEDNHEDGLNIPYPDFEKVTKDPEKLAEKKHTTLKEMLQQYFHPRGCFQSRSTYALYVLSPDNSARRFFKWLSTRKWFDYGVLVLIGINCITLAVERPSIPPDSLEREILAYFYYIFTLIFFIEMSIKILAKGLVVGPNTYLRDGWNCLDFFLVIISLADTCITFFSSESPKIFAVLRVLRLLRALRPLRVINRAPGLKLVVETLLSSLRPIGNIVLICLTFFLIFGILGVQLFRGTFFHCVGDDLRNVTTKTECLANPRNSWQNEKYNFDDLGNALMSLFVLSSKDGWVMIMYQGLDAVGLDMQPVENYNEWRLLYFVSFLLLVGFFVLNMFVGVVVENFHRCREAHEKEEREKREQRRLKKLAKKINNATVGQLLNVVQNNNGDNSNIANDTRQNEEGGRPSASSEVNQHPFHTSYGRSRTLVYKLVTNKYFDIAISIVIFSNVISMAIEHYQMSAAMVFALKIMNYVFTFIFVLEAAFKLVAFGFIRYLKERWNQLDILIIILSIVGIFLEEVETGVIPINPTIMRVMRILRIARVLKLLKVAKGIRALLDTVMVALPQVGNLGLLFFLLFFIFAALGVELFGRIECSSEHPCEGMGVHANFENSGAAFLTLFRIASGDNWNGIMMDALRENCDDSDMCVRNCCVNKVITPIYFVVFVLTAQFVLVNVVVAVLMKHLEDAHFSVEDMILKHRSAMLSLQSGGQILLPNQENMNSDNQLKEKDASLSLTKPVFIDLDINCNSTALNQPSDNKENIDGTHSCIKDGPTQQHKQLFKQSSLPPNFKINPNENIT